MKTSETLVLVFFILIATGSTSAQERPVTTTEGVLFSFQSAIDGKVGYVDRFGTIKIKPRFSSSGDSFENRENLREFSEGFAGVNLENSKYSYINEKGELISELTFDKVAQFSEGLGLVSLGSKFGFIDRTGKLSIPIKFEQAKSFFEDVAPACISGKCGYIDKTGNFVIEPKFDRSESFSEGLAAVMIDGKYGYIDHTGAMVIEPRFARADNFSEGLALVGRRSYYFKTEGPEGYINRAGKLVINTEKRPFHGYDRFSQGLAIIESNGRYPKYGYVDSRGRIVIAPRYHIAEPFSEGLAAVGYFGRIHPRIGYINRLGKTILRMNYYETGRFNSGFARVRIYSRPDKRSHFDSQSNRFTDAIINKNGKVIFKSRWVYAHEPAGDGEDELEPFLIEVSIDSNPRGAMVFMIPLVDLDDDPKLLFGPNLEQYRRETDTIYKDKVYEQVYRVVVELNGKRETRTLDVNSEKENKVIINFDDKVKIPASIPVKPGRRKTKR